MQKHYWYNQCQEIDYLRAIDGHGGFHDPKTLGHMLSAPSSGTSRVNSCNISGDSPIGTGITTFPFHFNFIRSTGSNAIECVPITPKKVLLSTLKSEFLIAHKLSKLVASEQNQNLNLGNPSLLLPSLQEASLQPINSKGMPSIGTTRGRPTRAELQNTKDPNNKWYAGMFSGFMVPPTAGAAESRNSNDFNWASERGNENREGVEDDNSTVGESLDALGRDLGSDMRSLPSLDEGSLEGSLGTLSLSKKVALPFSFLNPKKTETVESVVEKKINNLKSERSLTAVDKSVPYLQRRLQPRPPQVYTEAKKRTTPESIVDPRRHMLVRELRDAVAKYGRFDLRCANITAALGDLYDEIEDHIQAIRLHKDAVSVFTVKLGDNDQKALTARVRLGEVQENAREYDDAIGTYYYVISMTRALDGEKSPKAASVAMKMAETLRKKGENELAIKTLKKVLKIYREILGDGHPKVSIVVDDIAKLYVSIGDYVKASAILEQVVKLKAATMGATDKAVADSLVDLSSCYECAEQYNKAMKNLKKAYKIQEDLEGEASDACILTLERIGVIYQATGHFKKAAIAYLGVLRGRKHALGESHPTVADTYFHLAVSLRESGQEDKAFKCMKQALNIYVGEGKNMHDVMMIAEVMHELGVLHTLKGQHGESIKMLKQEIAVRSKLGQPEYPSTAEAMKCLGQAEYESKNHARALNHLKDARLVYEKAGKTSDIGYGEVLLNLGIVFRAMRKQQKCRDALFEALTVFKNAGCDSDHSLLSKTLTILREMGHRINI